jgi:methylisocitrate lyase
VLSEIKATGTQKASLDKMLTRAQLYDLIGYSGFEERDRRYFGGS